VAETETNDCVILKVRRGCYGHDSLVIGLDVLHAPPHVKAHVFDHQETVDGPEALALVNVVVGLGYFLTLVPERVELSMAEFMIKRGNLPDADLDALTECMEGCK
jgi:hypothetical protein